VALGGDLNRRLFSVSGNGRLDLWRAAWHDARAHPWLGSGAGTYEGWWYAHRPDQSTVRDAHGLYVETLAELGPPGLALLALALGIPLAVAIRARRHPFGAFAFAAYIAWLVHAGGDWDWELPGVVVPALLCGGALLVAAAGSRDEARQAGIRLRASGIGLAGAVGALAFIGLGGNVHLASSTAAAADGRWAASEDAARAALSWAPWSGEAWKLIADSQLHRGRRGAARVSLRKAIAKDPRNWKLYVELAHITRGAERRAAVARAAQLNPRQAAVRALEEGR
jgi:hypothetical protein